MSVMMSLAVDASGKEITIAIAQQGVFAKPLKCKYCTAPVSFVDAQTKQVGEDPVIVRPYFRRKNKQLHDDGCRFNVVGQLTVIVRESDPSVVDLFKRQSAKHFEMRLLAVKKAFDQLAQLTLEKKSADTHASIGAVERSYVAAEEKLGAYINSAVRVLTVRFALEKSQELEEALHLVFDGMRIRWNEFYFEREDYSAMYSKATRATQAYPMAAHGEVTEIKCVPIKNGESRVVLNLKKLVRATDDPKIWDSVQLSIWSSDPNFFNTYHIGDLILAFGLWRASPTALKDNKSPDSRVKQFRNHNISLSPIARSQLHKIADDGS